jgi:CDGSH-type Zn-finger protein/truncated hemoglobin YjbI
VLHDQTGATWRDVELALASLLAAGAAAISANQSDVQPEAAAAPRLRRSEAIKDAELRLIGLARPSPATGPLDAGASGAARPAGGGEDGLVGAMLGAITLMLDAASDEATDAVARRLFHTVVRPLAEAIADSPQAARALETARVLFAQGSFAPGTTAAVDQPAQLRSMAVRVSALARVEPYTGLREAAAGLQRLAMTKGGGADAEGWLRALTDADAEPTIGVAHDGPYLVMNVGTLTDHLGVGLPTTPLVALCRCGRSASKPFCDGSHVAALFSGEKNPKRLPDRRDTYHGQQIVIYDNRGLCAHSGFCTDRLASMFHAASEPFVTPSGGRLDEAIAAVRNCPSGALSFALGGREDRALVDSARPPAIEVSQDGPYRITGCVRLLSGEVADAPRLQGASLEHYSLCRCGASQNKPFCSGMHWYSGFADPIPNPAHEPTLFEWAGGYPALLRLSHIFYEKYVPQDPLVGPLFARMSPDHPERVAAWLSEVFGGPKWYTERYGGYERMISEHLNKGITLEQRAHWASLMAQSAEDACLPADAEFRAAFVAYIEWGSRIAVENSKPGVQPPPRMPVPRWWWVCSAMPGARPKAKAPGEADTQPVIALPDAATPVSFAAHIKPLFRAMDRNSMKFAFDLWAYDDVAAHGPAILERIRSGTMPCDGAWPSEKIEVLSRWLAEGRAP